jgi:hypothetical protein
MARAFEFVRCDNGHSGMAPIGTPMPTYCGRCGLWNVRIITPREAATHAADR